MGCTAALPPKENGKQPASVWLLKPAERANAEREWPRRESIYFAEKNR